MTATLDPSAANPNAQIIALRVQDKVFTLFVAEVETGKEVALHPVAPSSPPFIPLFTIDEMVTRRGIRRGTIERAIICGSLKVIRHGNWTRITDRAIDDWIRGEERIQ